MNILLIGRNSSALQKIESRIKTPVSKEKQDDAKQTNSLKKITDREGFEAFSLDSFPPEAVIVVPELNWSENTINEGYEIAHQLITQKLKDIFFQLIFVSVLSKEKIYELVDIKYRGYIETFPHYDLLDGTERIDLSHYSEVHFEMIKSLALSNDGRLDLLEHNLKNIRNNQQIDNETNIKLKQLLDDLSLFSAWTSQDIHMLTEQCDSKNNTLATKALIQKTENIIDEVKDNLPQNKPVNTKRKSNYRVLIIEDDAHTRNVLVETFSTQFAEVKPIMKEDSSFAGFEDNTDTEESFFQNDSNPLEILKSVAPHFHIVILDLLFTYKHGSWLSFNGLDIYKSIKEINPYACIRVITSLPREVIGRVVETTMPYKIPLSHVFTKSQGELALKNNVIDRVDELIEECAYNEKKKSSLKPYPKTGIFSWPGVPDLMYRLNDADRYEFTEFYQNEVRRFFNDFQENNLNVDSEGWNAGKLPSNRMRAKMTDHYFLINMKSVFVHRLIVISYVLKNPGTIIFYDDYWENVLAEISRKKSLKSAFFNKLGFSGKNVNRADGEGFKINLIDLLPEEIDYIASYYHETVNQQLLKEAYPELFDWFIDVLCDLQTYEDWDELKLDFDPYLEKREIDNTGTIQPKMLDLELLGRIAPAKVADFIEALIKNHDKVENLAAKVRSNYAMTNNIRTPKLIEILFNQL